MVVFSRWTHNKSMNNKRDLRTKGNQPVHIPSSQKLRKPQIHSESSNEPELIQEVAKLKRQLREARLEIKELHKQFLDFANDVNTSLAQL